MVRVIADDGIDSPVELVAGENDGQANTNGKSHIALARDSLIRVPADIGVSAANDGFHFLAIQSGLAHRARNKNKRRSAGARGVFFAATKQPPRRFSTMKLPITTTIPLAAWHPGKLPAPCHL